MFRFLILSALVGISVLVSACGGSSGDGALTKAEFIKQADQICERTDELQKVAMKAFLKNRSAEDLTKPLNEQVVVVVGLPPVRAEVEQLDALHAPDGDEERVQAIVDGVEKAVGKGEDDPGTMVNSGSLGPFAEAGKLAREYGLKACAFPL